MDTYHPHERYVLNDYRHQVEEDAGREPKEQSGCMFLALRAIAKLKPKDLKKKLEKDMSFGCENREFDEHAFLCNLVGHEEKVRKSQSQKLKNTALEKSTPHSDGPREKSKTSSAVSVVARVPGAVRVLSRGQHRGGQRLCPETALRLSGRVPPAGFKPISNSAI